MAYSITDKQFEKLRHGAMNVCARKTENLNERKKCFALSLEDIVKYLYDAR